MELLNRVLYLMHIFSRFESQRGHRLFSTDAGETLLKTRRTIVSPSIHECQWRFALITPRRRFSFTRHPEPPYMRARKSGCRYFRRSSSLFTGLCVSSRADRAWKEQEAGEKRFERPRGKNGPDILKRDAPPFSISVDLTREQIEPPRGLLWPT